MDVESCETLGWEVSFSWYVNAMCVPRRLIMSNDIG